MRLTELLKQPQYSPYTLDEEVMLVYAGSRGYLDEIPVDRIKEWQAGFLRFAKTQYPQIGQSISNPATKYDLTEDMEKLLQQAITEFNQSFS